MKTKILTSLIALAFITGSIFGQDSNFKTDFRQKYKWGFGIGAGFTTGYGLSVSYHPKKDGVQLNFFPYLDNYGKKQLICAGLTYMHDFYNNPYINTYLYVASSLTYNKNIGSINFFPFSNYYKDDDENSEHTAFNSGIGVGFEANTQKRVTVNLMLGYAQYNSFKQLFLTGEISLHYKFGKGY